MNGSNVINFNIENIPGSYAPGRFTIVFSDAKVLPLSFTSVRAYQQATNINVEWTVADESNTKQYEVEKSADGNNYAKVNVAVAKNSSLSLYSWKDVNAFAGFNYYRIKIVDANGKIGYSKIVNVFMGSQGQSVTVFPNPAKNGIINLQFENQPKGTYGLRLIDKNGQVMLKSQISHSAGVSVETIIGDKYMPHGIYQLELTKPDNTQLNINLLY